MDTGLAPFLTPKQRRVLDTIRHYQRAHGGLSPTVRALAALLRHPSIGHTQYFIDALVEKGYLARDPHEARSIRLAGPAASSVCPRCGQEVAA